MFFATCKWFIISLTLIIIFHYLYVFFLNTLTVPKIKDLVNKPNEQYKDMFASLHNNNNNIEKNDMADELTGFLKDLKKTQTQTQTQTLAGSDKGKGAVYAANELDNPLENSFSNY